MWSEADFQVFCGVSCHEIAHDKPTQCFEHGRTAGSRITRPVRARTDGRCFRGKAVEEDPGGAFGLVFDHSFSMRRDLGVFLPVGAALADALASAPDVEVALWRFGTEVERVEKTDNLKDIQLMGGTRTDVALDAALRWIETQPATEKASTRIARRAPCRWRSVACLRDKGPFVIAAWHRHPLKSCGTGSA